MSDSPELAAARKYNEDCGGREPHVRNLLRMVDELTASWRDEKRRSDSNSAVAGMLAKERDDLRAKLAVEQSRCIAEAQRASELEAKLAEAEKERGAWKERAQGDMNAAKLWAERAEAAEARVEHLEQEVAWRQAQIEGRIKTGDGL